MVSAVLARKERTKNLVQHRSRRGSPAHIRVRNEWEELSASFDIFTVPWQEAEKLPLRWPGNHLHLLDKHGPCQRAGSAISLPSFLSPVVATKPLRWIRGHGNVSVGKKAFDVERHPARNVARFSVVSSRRMKTFAVMDNEGHFKCPHVEKTRQDAKAYNDKDRRVWVKLKNKKDRAVVCSFIRNGSRLSEKRRPRREYVAARPIPSRRPFRWNNARAAQATFA